MGDASDVTHVSDSAEEAPAVQQRLQTLWVPPTDVDYFGQKDELIKHLQGLVGPHGYAISKKRSTNYRSGNRCGQPNRIWTQCDRGSKPAESKATKR
ncbi:MAG: hypothetical protein LQ350_002698, partial [Teloschistes chrysophthalmus]